MCNPIRTRSVMLPCIVVLMALALFQFPLPGVTMESAAAADSPGWIVQSDDITYAGFAAISAVDPSTAWAVGPQLYGSKDLLYKTSDGGDTWVPQDPVVYDSMVTVSALDANNVWAGGGMRLIKTSDGGTTWNLAFEFTSSVNIMNVEAVDAANIWMGGIESNGAVIYKTSDGGATWNRQFNYPTTGSKISDICAVNPDVAWAVGSASTSTSGPGYVLKTTDGGATWAVKAVGTTPDLKSVTALDAETAWVCGGSDYYDSGVIHKTGDGGATWQTQYSSVNHGMSGIDALDSSVAWAVGMSDTGTNGGIILKTIDGGASWSSQETPDPTRMFFLGVEAVDEANAWAGGAVGDNPMTLNALILKTSNGGDARPDIVSLIPPLGVDGTEVIIYGCDFGDSQGTSFVSFAGTQASTYAAWSDKQIKATVPAGMTGEIVVTVTTPEGTSNTKSFWKAEKLTVSSIVPVQGSQYAFAMNIDEIAGTGFQPGAAVRFEKGAAIVQAYNINVVSAQKLTCTVGLFGVEPGIYDVVVTNPDGQEARLQGAFTVTSPCGAGSSTALLMLGLTLGLLSLAGSVRMRSRRKKDS